MRPSKAAIQTARILIGEYYTAGEPSPAAMTQILQAVYDAQFGECQSITIKSEHIVLSDGSDLGPQYPPLKVLHSWEGHDGRYLLVPVEGGDDE